MMLSLYGVAILLELESVSFLKNVMVMVPVLAVNEPLSVCTLVSAMILLSETNFGKISIILSLCLHDIGEY